MPNIYRPVWGEPNIDRLFLQMAKDLLSAPYVDTGHWQAKRDVPQTATRELLNTVIEIPMVATAGGWASYMKPNLPWAEDHFRERVSSKPLNPPPSHVDWPYNQAGNKDHMAGEVFSHSYPERLWPRYAHDQKIPPVTEPGEANFGIRYEYGDLANAVDLLIQEPHTRQCFIPIWFPEDLCAASCHHQRVPCTLGYHMIVRSNRLHCFYPMRSLDLLRYFKDDAYMAGRLVQWILYQCRNNSGGNSVWHDVEAGLLTMHAVSLHIFEADSPLIKLMQEKKERVRA